jgi:prepilin-type N-terminal cleavage/methylation domain-containing protein
MTAAASDARNLARGAARGALRRGFTILELVLSLGILAILMVAAESAVLLASRAIPNNTSVPTLSVRSRQGLDGLNSELMFAKTVTELGPRAITFTIADRTGDGAPETLRYAWSGTPGDPVTRQYQTNPALGISAATAVPVVDKVYNFALGYDRRKVSAPPSATESAETLLYSNDPDPSLLGGLLGGGLADMGITSTVSVTQPFKPTTLTSTATGWRVTRVKYKAKSNGTTVGQYNVQIFNSSGGGTVSGSAVDGVSAQEASLATTYNWQTVTFTQTKTVPAANEQSVCFNWVSDAIACDLQYQTSGLVGGVLGLVSGGGSGSLCLYVYGTVTSPDPPGFNYFLLNVHQTLQIGADARSTTKATCRTLNEPQVTAP